MNWNSDRCLRLYKAVGVAVAILTGLAVAPGGRCNAWGGEGALPWHAADMPGETVSDPSPGIGHAQVSETLPADSSGTEPDGIPRPAPETEEGTDPGRAFSVSVDIRPGLCPNHLRLDSPLAIPIAVLGALDFELDLVDPETVVLYREGAPAEVEPAGYTYEDVGTPLVGGLCACHLLRGDGLDDLEFFFRIEDIAAALGLEEFAGDIVPLSLRGKLTTGEEFVGTDCALVIKGDWTHEEFGAEVGLLTEVGADEANETAAARYRFSYYNTVSERVTVAIYDTQGRMVARLNDMDMAPGIYRAVWNGKDEDRREVPAGIYFARVSNSVASETRKFVVAD